MAAMTTVLTEFSNMGNSRTSTTPGHTAVKPKLVIEKKRPVEGNGLTTEYRFKTVQATTDVDGIILPQKVTVETIVTYPLAGNAAEIASSLAVHRDIVAGDEFANSVSTLSWL